MAIKKKSLEPDYSSELDFLLLGISSGFKDYRICSELNRMLDIDLAREGDHVISLGRNNSNINYACFRYANEFNEEYVLLANKTAEHHLIPELKTLDYLLLIKSPVDINLHALRSKLLENSGIQSVFIIDVSKLKSRNNLIM